MYIRTRTECFGFYSAVHRVQLLEKAFGSTCACADKPQIAHHRGKRFEAAEGSQDSVLHYWRAAAAVKSGPDLLKGFMAGSSAICRASSVQSEKAMHSMDGTIAPNSTGGEQTAMAAGRQTLCSEHDMRS